MQSLQLDNFGPDHLTLVDSAMPEPSACPFSIRDIPEISKVTACRDDPKNRGQTELATMINPPARHKIRSLASGHEPSTQPQ